MHKSLQFRLYRYVKRGKVPSLVLTVLTRCSKMSRETSPSHVHRINLYILIQSLRKKINSLVNLRLASLLPFINTDILITKDVFSRVNILVTIRKQV